jgi:protein tyrosine phosphatase (PTP) superfamily phosphohydrolase (DUF442 family)
VLSAFLEIRNLHLISDSLATAGQPTIEQFEAIRRAGCEAVINLALPTSDHAVLNEGSIVTALGMTYTHIPVNFEQPTAADFRTFCAIMAAFQGKRLFIHCAANKRVAAFVYLYKRIVQKSPAAEAQRDLDVVWEPDETWNRFIQKQLSLAEQIKGA